MAFPWYVAKRYFKAKHRFAFISLISRISIAGLAIGIAALILTVSILSGFETTLEEKLISFDGHIRLRYFLEQPMDNLPSLVEELDNYEEISRYAPYISHEAMIKTGSYTDGVVAEAVPDTAITKVLGLSQYITQGTIDFSRADEAPGMVLSTRLAKKLQVDVGDKVALFSIQGVPGPRNFPRAKQFQIQALYNTGMIEYDDVYCYIPFESGQDLFKMEQQAHGFILMLNDASIADPFSTQLQNELGYPYYPRSWRESHASLFAWFQSQQYPIVLVFGLIAVVAIFNIMSTLMMIVLEKTKNIGLLKAVGSTNKSIMRIFVYNGLFIGFIGCFAGTSLGLLLGELQRRFNLLQLPADVYFMASVPIEFNWEHILIINGVLMFFAVIASLYPSLRAAKREPVETLTYE